MEEKNANHACMNERSFLEFHMARSHIEMQRSGIEMALKKTKIAKIRIIPSRTLQHFMQKECTKQ